TLSFATSINILAAMVIGGSASILGSLLGGVYYVLVPFVAGQVNPSRAAMYSGIILLVILFVLPGGLTSLPRALRRLRRRRDDGPGTRSTTAAGPADDGGTQAEASSQTERQQRLGSPQSGSSRSPERPPSH